MLISNEKDTFTKLDEIIYQAAVNLMSDQRPDGEWDDCFDTGVMSDAQTAISLHLLGVTDDEWTKTLLQRIESNRRADGTWSVHPDGEGDLSTTVECYYALRLFNRWTIKPDDQDRTKNFILRTGGLKKCRNLTKVFLAVGGEIPWEWLPSPRLYSWLFAEHTPIHIFDIVTFTRLHVAPMLLLSSLRYVSEFARKPVLKDLMFNDHRKRVHRALGSPLREVSFGTQRRLTLCREFMLREREADGTAAGYHSSTLLILFALRAMGYSLSSPSISKPLHAIRANLYVNEEIGFTHQQTCNAHVWNTSLAVNALHGVGGLNSVAVQRGVRFLVSRQQPLSDDDPLQASGNRETWKLLQGGAWGFSSNNTKHPDTDDTVSSLEAIKPFRHRYRETWLTGVQWLIAMQNQDGGWSAFEKNSNKWWLEWLPANDMQRTMTDPSTADITGRVLKFLIQSQVVSSQHKIIHRGLNWLRQHQERTGSWFGRWGTTYLYGTWCAVQALTAAQVPSYAKTLTKTKYWLLSVQKLDGSFGESAQSELDGQYVPLDYGTPSQTAWGLDALLHLLEVERNTTDRMKLWSAAQKAASWLMVHSHNGRWEEVTPTGSAFPGSLYIRYHIYPKVWPLMALKHYRELTLKFLKGGEMDVGSTVIEYVSGAHRKPAVLAAHVSHPTQL